MGLAVLTAGSLAVGFASNSQKAAKADDPDTWMFSVGLNMKAPETSYSELSNYRVHIWGTNVNETYTLNQSGSEHLYTKIIALKDNQTVTGLQFVFYQAADQNSDKYSIDLNVSFEGKDQLSKDDNPGYAILWKATTNWTESKWDAERIAYTLPFVRHESDPKIVMDTDPANKQYVVRNIECPVRFSDVYDIVWFNNTTYASTFEMIRSGAEGDDNVPSGDANWVYLDKGTFDIYFTNEFANGGTVRIIKHVDVSSYIYYVSASSNATTDYIYSWGGNSQFGSFPGTAITSVTGVSEVSGNGVMHFQNNNIRIYKIPVTIGYPGDTSFNFNNGTNSYQTADLTLVAGAAYWWEGGANANAGAALDLLIRVEEKRNAVTADGDVKAYSICGISQSDAAALYNDYKDLDSSIKPTYIDCSKTYTYVGKDSNDQQMTSFYDIFVELAKIGHVSASYRIMDIYTNNNVSIVIIVVSALTLASMVAFIFVRKKNTAK